MRRKQILFAFLLLAVLSMAAAVREKTETAETLLGAALHQEEVEGNFQAAIATYQKLLSRHSTNRSVAARAQFRIGACYEKLGKMEARKAYEVVVQDYADQQEFAAAARARLAALGEAKPANNRDSAAPAAKAGPILSELKLESAQDKYALSPDGTQIVYTNRSQNLVLRDLASGREKQITNIKRGIALSPVWSPDGKKIAYTNVQNIWKNELRIVSIETGEDQHREINGWPMDWSKDGRFILYFDIVREKPHQWTVSLLPVSGGPVQEVLKGNTPFPRNYRISPDSRYIAYSVGDNRTSQIRVASLNGGESVKVTDGSASDNTPIWTPDGKMILFSSNRTFGRFDLWGVPMFDGKPAGKPFVLKPDLGRFELFSVSENGRLLLLRRDWKSDLYVTEVDPETGKATGQARSLTRGDGGYLGTWSPDGKRIAYMGAGNVLRVMLSDGSQNREVVTVLRPFKGPFSWNPDNDHIYFPDARPASPATGKGIYSVSVSTGEIKPVLLDDAEHIVCSPDGKRIAFTRASSMTYHIFLVDTDGKNVRQVTFEDTAKVAYPAWSPDGKRLAYFKYGGPEDRNYLMIVDVDAGTHTDVLSGPRGETARKAGVLNATFWDITWSPDGTKLAWSEAVPRLPGEEVSMEIRVWRLGQNEKPQEFQIDLGSPTKVTTSNPRWSPDGRKMLFSAATSTYQLLLMDNFLPKPEPEKTNVVSSR